ncbi:MAG: adenosylmethionine--8-amino-7-oxononanoate transaminase, partial [Pirellulales bacterium]|nr:adenosylmethionine--8-amino-7-oxononanoate transaminase [Pirellulales bacterium]
VWLEDVNGNRYLDANGSWWVNTLGHAHPRLVRALADQAEQLAHCSMAGVTNPNAILLARDLVEIAPDGLERVFFSDDGSTAVEVAVKIAFQYWQQNGRPKRSRFVALSSAFHGDTLGAVALGGVEAFRSAFGPLLMDVVHGPEPSDELGWQHAIDHIEDALRASPDEIAGVIVEPMIQGAAGMRIWPAEQLARLRDITNDVDTFLIADEVFTGYARTAKMWACDHAGIVPDMMCVAKAFSGGMLPMAATLATARVYDGFRGDKSRALMHGHSFCGNPLGAAVAREVIAVYRDEDVLGQVQRKAPIIADAFERLERLPGVLRTRSLGMVAAADLGDGGYGGRIGWRVYEEALGRGVYLRPLGDTVYITPPLTIPDADLQTLLDVVHESVEATMDKR